MFVKPPSLSVRGRNEAHTRTEPTIAEGRGPLSSYFGGFVFVTILTEGVRQRSIPGMHTC